MAAKPGRATVLAQMRWERGRGLPLRRYRYCTVETGRAAAGDTQEKYKIIHHRDTEDTERKDKRFNAKTQSGKGKDMAVAPDG